MTTKKRRRLLSEEPCQLASIAKRQNLLNKTGDETVATAKNSRNLELRNIPQLNHKALEQLVRDQSPKHLDMSCCFQLDMESLKSIFEKWGKNLISLNLEYCDFITDNTLAVLLGGPLQKSAVLPLRRINLSHTNISDLGIRFLVQRCPKLKHITLKACHSITNTSLSLIAQHCQHVSSLNFAECSNITDYGVQIIAQQSKTNLSLLDLNDCPGITDQIFQYLCFYCPNLKQLRIRGTHISADGILHMVSTLALTELNVHGLEISDDMLRHIGYHQKKLQILDISFCHGVTATGIRTLFKGCPMLRELHLFGNNNLTSCEIDSLRWSAIHVFF